jgi:hypothetical protein
MLNKQVKDILIALSDVECFDFVLWVGPLPQSMSLLGIVEKSKDGM